MKSSNALAIVFLLAVVVLSVILSGYVFLRADLTVEVEARIYSANHNIGVLNEEAVFVISIRNDANSTRKINVVIEADEHVPYNKTIVIEPVSSTNFTITQKLLFLGSWYIQFFEDREVFDGKDREIAGGYSFITVVNEAEAEMKITQLDNMKLDRTLSISAIIISIAAATSSIVNVLYTRKRFIRDTKRAREREAEERSSLRQEAREIALREIIEEEKQKLKAKRNNQKEKPE